jgi:integrase
MGRHLGKLTALFVARAKQPGLYGDGGNLWLQVEGESAKSWLFRYASHYMGLGSAFVVSLQEARELAHDYRRLRQQGIDPIEARRAKQAQQRLDAAKAITFKQCAEAYINARRSGWRDAKHIQQWENTLATYAEPIGTLPVQAVDTTLVCKVLEPIWSAKPETASRVRGRIESILDWAKVRGYREGENPARWRGHLDKLFPSRSKVRKTKHHLALPYMEVSAFVAELQKREGIGARAFEFAILTAARSGEVLGGRWQEFDLDAAVAVWTVPAARMKAGREHRVPLAPHALQIIKDMARSPIDQFVFPSGPSGQPLSARALWRTLSRMGIARNFDADRDDPRNAAYLVPLGNPEAEDLASVFADAVYGCIAHDHGGFDSAEDSDWCYEQCLINGRKSECEPEYAAIFGKEDNNEKYQT